MSRLLEAENRDQFTQELLNGSDPKHPHTARMAERAQRYIGGMDEPQRDAFLEAALEFAWQQRHQYNAQYEPLWKFWERCLSQAALSREKWLVSVCGPLPGTWEKRWILGRRLGRRQ